MLKLETSKHLSILTVAIVSIKICQHNCNSSSLSMRSGVFRLAI